MVQASSAQGHVLTGLASQAKPSCAELGKYNPVKKFPDETLSPSVYNLPLNQISETLLCLGKKAWEEGQKKKKNTQRSLQCFPAFDP